MVTDSHYADTAKRGSRYYDESISKMQDCVALMNQKKVDFLIELGDFIDRDPSTNKENTLRYLKMIESVYRDFNGPRYHVLGNHDFDCLSKEEFLEIAQNTGISPNSHYYSFDLKDLHFVILDANYRRDGSEYEYGNFEWRDTNIPTGQINWLKEDLNYHESSFQD